MNRPGPRAKSPWPARRRRRPRRTPARPRWPKPSRWFTATRRAESLPASGWQPLGSPAVAKAAGRLVPVPTDPVPPGPSLPDPSRSSPPGRSSSNGVSRRPRPPLPEKGLPEKGSLRGEQARFVRGVLRVASGKLGLSAYDPCHQITEGCLGGLPALLLRARAGKPPMAHAHWLADVNHSPRYFVIA